MDSEFIKFAQTRHREAGRLNSGLRIACVMALVVTSGPAVAGPIGVGLDVDVGSGGLNAGLDVGIGGSNVGVDVGIGGSGGSEGGVGVGVDIGLGAGGGTGPGGPGGPGVLPGPGKAAKANTAGRGAGWICARDANETAYNDFVVRARNGDAIGWVHGATVSPDGKLLVIRLQSAAESCFKLSGAAFRVKGKEVWANVESSAFR